MSRMIFVNLPVRSIPASRAFFTALGFGFNEEFCDDGALCLAIDDNIHVVLLQEARFRTFVNGEVCDATRSTEVLTCLSAESREEVDSIVARAVEAGGKPWRDGFAQGPMYGGSFQDLDGHVWELMHMDAAAATA